MTCVNTAKLDLLDFQELLGLLVFPVPWVLLVPLVLPVPPVLLVPPVPLVLPVLPVLPILLDLLVLPDLLTKYIKKFLSTLSVTYTGKQSTSLFRNVCLM